MANYLSIQNLGLMFLFVVLPSHADEQTIWLENPNQLLCKPKIISQSDTITLTLGPDHGRELGIFRHSDHTWYFLIIGSPPENAKTLMTPEEFEKVEQLDIPASLVTTEWRTGEDVPVFSTSGLYTIYVSVMLESEAGGYICTIRYIP